MIEPSSAAPVSTAANPIPEPIGDRDSVVENRSLPAATPTPSVSNLTGVLSQAPMINKPPQPIVEDMDTATNLIEVNT